MYSDVWAMYEHVITPSHPPKHLFSKEYSEGRKKLKNVGTEIMSIQTKVIKLWAHVLTIYSDVRSMYEHVIIPSRPPKHLFSKE